MNVSTAGVNGNKTRQSRIPETDCDIIDETPPIEYSEGGSNNALLNHRMFDLMTQILQQNATIIQQSSMTTSGLPNFHVIPDLSKSVGDFTGHETPVEARQWLDQIEASARVHNWPEAFLYETATMHLKLAARSWFQSHRGGFRSWQHFREAFKKSWIPALRRTQLWEKMRNRKQRDNECFADYYHEKVKLCKILGLPFEEIKEQVSSGLLSRDSAVHALCTVYRDEDELFHGLVTFERTLKTYDTFRNRKSKEPSASKTKTDFNIKKIADNSQSGEDEGKSKSMVKCFNCQKIGHYANKCPEPKKA